MTLQLWQGCHTSGYHADPFGWSPLFQKRQAFGYLIQAQHLENEANMVMVLPPIMPFSQWIRGLAQFWPFAIGGHLVDSDPTTQGTSYPNFRLDLACTGPAMNQSRGHQLFCLYGHFPTTRSLWSLLRKSNSWRLEVQSPNGVRLQDT